MNRIFLGISLGIFIFVISLNANSASATHHGTDSTYPSAVTNYVDFTINPTCSSIGTTDVDKDGICDSWENSGTGLIIDIPKGVGGSYHYEYKCAAAGGPDPDCPGTDKRDIYLELDWMNYHEPSSGVLTDIKNAFLTAPATSDGVPAGIRLHTQYGEDTTRTNTNEWGLIKYPGTTPFHVNSMRFYTATATNDGFYKVKENFFGTVQERLLDTSAPSDTLTAKRQVFHYAIIGHKQLEYPSNSGIAEIWGNDLFVTLGSFGSPTSPPYEIGSVDQQEATLMHELGHNLNLRHGGSEDANCKPNYVSIMNYRLQFASTFDSTRPLDFSRKALLNLNEGSLNEGTGVGSYMPDSSIERKFSYSSASPNWDMTGAPPTADDVDWDGSGISGSNVSANIDNFSGCANTVLSPNLVGYDDWDNLRLDASATPTSNFGTGASPDIPVDEIISEEDSGDSTPEIVTASSGGAEMSVDIDRGFRQLNLIQIANLIGNLPDKNQTNQINNMSDKYQKNYDVKQALNQFVLDAMEANSHDDLVGVSKKLGELKQESNLLIEDNETRAQLINLVNEKIIGFERAQDIGGHALPKVDSGMDLTDLKNEIENLGNKISNMDSKIDNMDSKIDNMDSKIGNLDSKIGDLSIEIGGLKKIILGQSDNSWLLYLILGIVVASLIIFTISIKVARQPAWPQKGG